MRHFRWRRACISCLFLFRPRALVEVLEWSLAATDAVVHCPPARADVVQTGVMWTAELFVPSVLLSLNTFGNNKYIRLNNNTTNNKYNLNDQDFTVKQFLSCWKREDCGCRWSFRYHSLKWPSTHPLWGSCMSNARLAWCQCHQTSGTQAKSLPEG